MFRQRVQLVQDHLRSFILDRYGIELGGLTVETPPRTEFGDLAFPFPFELAKMLRRSPRQIALETAARATPPEPVERFEAAGAGYVNVFFKRVSFFRDLCRWVRDPFPPPRGEKVIVEHTNINPNKAAHIGHLRNAALGDTFVRLLRAAGHPVEVQNYIDNTGVQVADVIVGFQRLRGLSLEEVQAIGEPFDYYCWDLYAEVSDWYEKEPGRLSHRQHTLQEIEAGRGETARLAEDVSTRIVRAHLKTMFRMGVQYDVLPRESEILHLKFWEEAFQMLRETGAVHLVEEGTHGGCWVMKLPGEGEEEADRGEEKVIVRSNGTVTYVGKDIAYQLWKFGLLGKTFHYRPFFEYPDGKVVWMSGAEPFGGAEPSFGSGQKVYNVIDVRQSYLQRVVVQGLRSLGFEKEASRSVHFSYEMVALSPACCAELGIELSEEDRAKPFVEVSGRRGLGVKADDLIRKLEENTLREVEARQPDLPAEQRARIARQIAIGALRYFLLKYVRTSVIAFDFSEALNFEGETGPYLQYSVVRAGNIFRKLEAAEGSWDDEAWKKRRDEMWERPEALADVLADPDLWSLLLHVARIDDTIDQSIRTLEMSYLAKHAFTLAQQFNLFYHRCHILSEENRFRKTFYLSLAHTAREGLQKALDLLGIEVPERM